MTAGTALRLAIEAQPDMPWTSEQQHTAQVALNMSNVREATLLVERLQLPVGCFPTVWSNEIEISLTKYKEWGTYDYDTESSLDVEGSKRNMAMVMKQLPRPIKKEYTENYFKATHTMLSGFKIILTISRQTVCKKVVKGEEWVPPTEGHYKEVVDYECEKITFTGLAADE